MDFNENQLDIEGLLVDTRMSDNLPYKFCGQKECQWHNLPACHFCPSCMDAFFVSKCSNDINPDSITVVASDCPQNTMVRMSRPVVIVSDAVSDSSTRTLSAHSVSSNNDYEELSSANDIRIRHRKMRRLSGVTNSSRGECVNAWELEGQEQRLKTVCDQHAEGELTLFCVTCEVPVCRKCASGDHEAHFVCKRFEEKSRLERDWQDFDDGFFEEVKGRHCKELSAALTRASSELKQQHSVATERISGKYKHSKWNLKKWRDDSLQNLSDLLADQESQLTEIYDNLQKLDKHSEDACQLVMNILRCGNALDILSMKNFVKTQLLQIINKSKSAPDFEFGEEIKSLSEFSWTKEVAIPARPIPSQSSCEESDLNLCTSVEKLTVEREEARKLEETRKQEEARKLEAARRLEEAQKLEETRKQEEARKLEGARRLEEARKYEEVLQLKEAFKMTDSVKLQEVANKLRGAVSSKAPIIPSRNYVGAVVINSNPSAVPFSREPLDLPMDICLEFGESGNKEGQFERPKHVCVGWDGDLYVADSGNHRVQVFNKNGHFRFEFGEHGSGDGQLNHPIRVVAFKDSGKIIVADYGQFSSRLQLFSKEGKFIRKIVTRSAIKSLTALAILHNGNIAITDKDKGEILVINESGELLVKFGYKNRLVHPCDIVLWGNEFFVNDFTGHAVVVFGEDGSFKRRFESKLKSDWYPGGIALLDDDTVLVGFTSERRLCVVGFNRVGQEMFNSRCPPRRVTTCGGLQLTPDGNLVTVTKRENTVIVAKIHFKGKR